MLLLIPIISRCSMKVQRPSAIVGFEGEEKKVRLNNECPFIDHSYSSEDEKSLSGVIRIITMTQSRTMAYIFCRQE